MRGGTYTKSKTTGKLRREGGTEPAIVKAPKPAEVPAAPADDAPAKPPSKTKGKS